jgi:hypothetical protein
LEALNKTNYYSEPFTNAFLLIASIYSALYDQATWPAFGYLMVSYLDGTAQSASSAPLPANSTLELYN